MTVPTKPQTIGPRRRRRFGLLLALIIGLPVLVAAAPVQVDEPLTPPGGRADAFGLSVAIDGEIIVVGAPEDDVRGNNAGAVYVFDRATRDLIATIRTPDAVPNHYFGSDVDVSGDTLVIGASMGCCGADIGAFIFQKPLLGSWADATQVAHLSHNPAADNTWGGWAVAVEDDTIVMTQWGRHGDGSGAWVFTRPLTGWADADTTTATRLVGPDSDGPADGTGAQFGWDVDLSGDTIVVGAPHHDTWASRVAVGAAYVFTKPPLGAWSDANATRVALEGDFDPAERAQQDFGYSVSVSGDTIAVGAYDDARGLSGDPLYWGAGSTYVFERDLVGTWTRSAKLVASTRIHGNHFGSAVDVSEDESMIAIGAEFDSDWGYRSGSAFLAERPAAGWSDARLDAYAPNPGVYTYGFGAGIGHDVAVHDGLAIAGTTRHGTAWLFRSATPPPPSSTNLSVATSDSVDPVTAGESLTYSVTVENTSTVDAADVALAAEIPDGTSFVSATDGGVEAAGSATWDLGTLEAGSSVTVHVTVDVDASRTAALSSTATASTSTPEDDVDDNSATEETDVATSADVSIVKYADAHVASAGDPVTYTLAIHNDGPSDAQDVEAVDVLPADATFVSATASQGSCGEVSGVVTCALGTLAAGGDASVQIEVTFGAVGTFDNTATVSSSTSDPDHANNVSTETVTVRPIRAKIDIKPGSSENPINMGSRGSIPVAILTTDTFDATLVDTTSLTFGATGDEDSLELHKDGRPRCGVEDVDLDGDLDVVCHFTTQATGFDLEHTEGILRGTIAGGLPFEGRDNVRVKI